VVEMFVFFHLLDMAIINSMTLYVNVFPENAKKDSPKKIQAAVGT